jgi:DNA-binding MarR family transcriptional regulator
MAVRGDRTDAGLDEVLTWNLVRVARFAGQRLAERLAGHGLHPVHFGVLAHLVLAPEMTQADIARAVLQRPQSIAPLLDGLEERGLIRRTGDRARGRRNPVQITDDGRRALDAVWDIALSTNDLSDAGLTAQESVELNRLLLKLVRATQGTRQDAPGEQ